MTGMTPQAKHTSHTPGPWADKHIISITQSAFLPPQEQEANTRLIFAAPELLEALKAIDGYLKFDRVWEESVTRKMAMEAIAKAEGRP